MRASFGSLSVVPWILFAQMTWNMDAVPAFTAESPPSRVSAEVRDRGGVFGRVARRRAREALGQIRRDHRVPALIETIESLGGRAIEDEARRRARPLPPGGIYILVAGHERDVAVVLGRHEPDGRPSDPDQAAIREAFLGPLRAGDPDRALGRGVRAIVATLAGATASGARPDGRGAPVSAAVLLGFVAVLLVNRVRTNRGGASRRRRRAREVSAEETATPARFARHIGALAGRG